MAKNEENFQNPKCLIKFSEIWYVDAFQQKKCYKKNFFSISAFFGQKITAKKTAKNEENWQNSNRFMEFSEFWYVDTSQQKKMLQKNYFSISAFLGLYMAKKSSQN